MQEINIEICSNMNEIKREAMEEKRYHNMSEKMKQKLKEYQKSYCANKKTSFFMGLKLYAMFLGHAILNP